MRSGPEPAAAEQLRPRPDTDSGRSLFIYGFPLIAKAMVEKRHAPQSIEP